MPITIEYASLPYQILIPKADTTFLEFDAVTGREKRQYSADDFWRELAALQDNEDDVWAPTAYINNVPVDLDVFVQGRSVVVQSPYVVTFEAGDYSVAIIDGNNNIQARSTVNGVQVLPSNTAGLVQVTSGSGVTAQDKTDIIDGVWNKTLP